MNGLIVYLFVLVSTILALFTSCCKTKHHWQALQNPCGLLTFRLNKQTLNTPDYLGPIKTQLNTPLLAVTVDVLPTFVIRTLQLVEVILSYVMVK